ncbi:MltA domain-containing protein [Brevundimonas balnearis]|uniref:peptidoglycan lytic exotransglycosylase n=1 Tax=Brevundimonas balnearis TaxID=1572858 RepID=A0ABV6R249_9CAUL
MTADGTVAALPGWAEEDHRAALRAYAATCRVAPGPAERAVCAAAADLAPFADAARARAFFETRFTAVPAETADGRPGLLTAYFAPEYPARATPSAEFDAAVLARPSDLVRQGGQVMRRTTGGLEPYPDRAAIEAGAVQTEILGWMRTEDLFFMQIQGSGYLTFEDGRRVRAAYAADNGRPFVGIARPMAERGLLPPNGTSGEAIRAWLAARRGPEARAITALNPRYIFFQLQPDDGEPVGAAGVPLVARRSIAVDPASWRYGDLVFIDADGGNLAGARASYRGLVTALDTGSAIRGPVRADFYMGRGDAAGEEAGTVRHPLRMWRLVPR